MMSVSHALHDRRRVRNDREDGQHEQRRQQARHHEVRDRIVGERLERIDLLGDAHRADLRGHARADAAREHECREQRPELEHDAAAHEETEHGKLDTREELIERLERGHRAEEPGHDHNERHRVDADVPHLPERLAAPRGGLGERAEDVADEVAALADAGEDAAPRPG